jgi:hypothetical protein
MSKKFTIGYNGDILNGGIYNRYLLKTPIFRHLQLIILDVPTSTISFSPRTSQKALSYVKKILASGRAPQSAQSVSFTKTNTAQILKRV